jgi:hypothetical protein
MKKIKVEGYYRKPAMVREHWREWSYVPAYERNVPRKKHLSEFNIQQILQPKVTTVVEISPDTGKLLKQLIFTLSGALVVAAALRSR